MKLSNKLKLLMLMIPVTLSSESADLEKRAAEYDLRLNRAIEIYELLQGLDTDQEYAAVIEKPGQSFLLYEKDGRRWNIVYNIDASTGTASGPKERWGDDKTPEGIFNIIEIVNSEHWISPWDKSRGVYGPYFMRLSTGSWNREGIYNPYGRSSIGIHGTNEPEKLGQRASRGCIRIENQYDRMFVEEEYLTIGTPVIIAGNDWP